MIKNKTKLIRELRQMQKNPVYDEITKVELINDDIIINFDKVIYYSLLRWLNEHISAYYISQNRVIIYWVKK